MKALKISIYILLIAVILFVLYKLVYASIMYAIDRISYDIKIKSVYLKSIKIAELIKNGQTDLEVRSQVDIKNPTPIAIKLKDVYITIYYEGRKIAESYAPATYKILSHKDFSIDHNVRFLVNDKSAKLIAEVAASYLTRGVMPVVDYKVDFKLFFVKASYNDTYQIEF